MEINKYEYWLGNIKGIGSKKILNLLEYAQTAYNIYHLSEHELKNVKLIGEKDRQNIMSSKNQWDLDKEKEKILKMGVSYVTVENAHYPERLRELSGMPYGIYYKGILPKDNVPIAAIVGARMCSQYGKKIAQITGEKLASMGVSIISGLAVGIDSAGHKGAVEACGITFGVLGCGVDICYPRDNIELYMQMQKNGGLISEQPLSAPPAARNFPARNRIISGLSDLVIIIEAKEKSGSLITADFALEQGKDVYAFPGKITDTLSGGCNRLIKQGAGIITGFEDLEEITQNVFNIKNLKYKDKGTQAKKNNIVLEKKELLVYSCLSLEPKNIDKIITEIDLNVNEIMKILTKLNIYGIIEEPVKNYYQQK